MNLIIFDLDGTLVRLPIDYDSLRRRLYAEFGDKRVFESIYKFLLSLDDKGRERAFKIIDEFELGSISSMYVDPTLNEGFSLIEDFEKALVTLQGLKPAKKILERIGLKDKFSIIVTREVSLDRTQQLMYVMNRLEANKEKTVFIGDTENDFRAAKTVGIVPIIVGSDIDGRNIDNILSAIKVAIRILQQKMARE